MLCCASENTPNVCKGDQEASPDEMLVNELFIGDHGKIRQTCEQIGRHRTGGFQQHLCFMPFKDQCSYKYLLNSASIGYANKVPTRPTTCVSIARLHADEPHLCRA